MLDLIGVAPKACTVKELQKILGIGRNNAYELLNKPGGIKAIRVGKKYVIPLTEIDRWLAQSISLIGK